MKNIILKGRSVGMTTSYRAEMMLKNLHDKLFAPHLDPRYINYIYFNPIDLDHIKYDDSYYESSSDETGMVGYLWGMNVCVDVKVPQGWAVVFADELGIILVRM